MLMDLQKLLKIVALIIGIISIFFLITIISYGDDSIRAIDNPTTVNSYMYLAYFVLILTVISVIVFTILNFISNAAALKSTLISVGSFILLSLICYFIFASGEETMLKDGSVLSTSQSKLIGAGLYLFYSLAFIAGGTMFFFGIKKSFKK